MNRSILFAAFCALFSVLNPSHAQTDDSSVTSLGRIEPKGGVIALAGPSGSSAVITQLNVEEGEQVEQGQVLATLDSYAKRKADLDRLQTILNNATKQLNRRENLSRSAAISEDQLDEARLNVQVAKADIAVARAELNQAQIKSPVAGQVLEIYARPGERIGENGLLELGNTQSMYVVAEVYETDISKVRIGQRATITSDAFPMEITGKVERIGLKVGKMEALATDPISRADARVVEVEIRLDDSSRAADLTNLQVEVILEA